MRGKTRFVILRIVHIVPGRIRFSCPALERGELSADQLQQPLKSCACLSGYEANPVTGSLIIHFNPEQLMLKQVFLCLIRIYPWARIIPPASGLPKFPAPRLPNFPEFPKLWKSYELKRMILIGVSIVMALLLRDRYNDAYNRIMPCWLTSVSRPIFKEAYKAIVRDRCFCIEHLDMTAIAMSLFRRDYLPSLIMILLYTLGDFIRKGTGEYSRRTIRDLMKVKENTAWVIRQDKETPIDADLLRPDDLIIVHTGEMIPADGVIVDGTALVDQQSLTGELLPVYKKAGEQVYAAARLKEGELFIRALKTGQYTIAANTVKIIEKALEQKIHFHHEAEELANRLVPLTFLGAGLSFLLTGSPRSVMSVFMIDYGSGIRISAPVVIMISLIMASRKGIFIKNGNCLEQLSKNNAVIFDKTGTLTYGLPEIAEVISYNEKFHPETILALAAAAEIRTSHPVARAIRNKARQMRIKVPKADFLRCDVGFGVSAKAEGRNIIIGNYAYMEHCKVNCEDFPSSEDLGGLRGENPASLIFIAVSNRLAGAISYQDALRPESRQVIEGLKARGVEKSMLISGDSKNVVCQVSQTLGIEDYYGETFPQEKSRIISRLKTKGFMTVMVGDGINDGPALAVSDVGISMKESSDVARETADVVLLNNNLTGLLDLLDISRQTMIRLRECSRMILIPSVAAMGLAVPGLIGPGMATFVNDGAAVLACIHAVRAGMKEA